MASVRGNGDRHFIGQVPFFFSTKYLVEIRSVGKPPQDKLLRKIVDGLACTRAYLRNSVSGVNYMPVGESDNKMEDGMSLAWGAGSRPTKEPIISISGRLGTQSSLRPLPSREVKELINT